MDATPEPIAIEAAAGPPTKAPIIEQEPDDPTRLSGYAWLVFPSDPDDPDLAGYPFLSASGEPTTAPEGAVYHVPLSEDEPGITVGREGATFLAVTRAPLPPTLKPGWDAEPAKLSLSFRAELGEIVLRRAAGVVRSPKGPVLRCEFELRG